MQGVIMCVRLSDVFYLNQCDAYIRESCAM